MSVVPVLSMGNSGGRMMPPTYRNDSLGRRSSSPNSNSKPRLPSGQWDWNDIVELPGSAGGPSAAAAASPLRGPAESPMLGLPPRPHRRVSSMDYSQQQQLQGNFGPVTTFPEADATYVTAQHSLPSQQHLGLRPLADLVSSGGNGDDSYGATRPSDIFFGAQRQNTPVPLDVSQIVSQNDPSPRFTLNRFDPASNAPTTTLRGPETVAAGSPRMLSPVGGPRMEAQNRSTLHVVQPRAVAPRASTHWVAQPQTEPTGASVANLSTSVITAETQQEINKMSRVICEKSEEIMKLRASLSVALQSYAYTPGDAPSVAEKRFLNAVTQSIAQPDDAPQLIVDQAPPHVQGMPTLPVPLEINVLMGEFHGFLDMLETEDKTFFKKSWKARFVVADQHGVSIYRDEADFKHHAFHKMILYAPYHDFEYFVPSFREAMIPEMVERAALASDATHSALTQVMAIAQQHATDTKNQYFGFISKSSILRTHQSKNANPQMVFRTPSWQEHGDWAHFFAKCFNIRLYRDMFPMMLAETLFGLQCQSCQTETIEEEPPAATGDAALLSPPPPLPPGPPSDGALQGEGQHNASDEENEPASAPLFVAPTTQDAGTDPDFVGIRVAASQTEDLAQWVSAIPTTSTEVLGDEATALQLHIHALEDQCRSLREEVFAVKLERDVAVDHAASLQASLSTSERETKRLRQSVLDEHEKATTLFHEAQASDSGTIAELQQQLLAAQSRDGDQQVEIERLNAEVSTLRDSLAVQKQQYDEKVKALADKAVADIDLFHDQLLKAEAPTSTSLLGSPNGILSPPRHMLVEGTTDSSSVPSRRLGALEIFANLMGDIQFNMQLDDPQCRIVSTREVKEELRKTWTLQGSSIVDGKIEVSVALQWNDDDEVGLNYDDDDASSVASNTSSVGLPVAWESPRHHHHPSSSSSAVRHVREESSQQLLQRLQRPLSIVGRVGLPPPPRKPFVPYV